MKKPLLTKERIVYWLTSFKSGDIEDIEYQRQVIDTLVNSVFVYDSDDGGRTLVLTFNISGDNTRTLTSSDIERYAPPNKKTRFGVSFCLVLTPLRPPLNLHQSGEPAFEKPHVERGNDI